MTRVKICGLSDPETAAAAAAAGADMIGLMFAESRRRVTPQECHNIVARILATRRDGAAGGIAGPARGEVSARTWFHAWAEALDDAIARYRPLIVGVFADQPVDEVNDIASAAGLDLIQLSGGESDEFGARTCRPYISVRHVAAATAADDLTEAVRPGPAAIMLDRGRAGVRGGTGESFDWSIAAEFGERQPYVLAGGLDPANVARAVAQARPWAVDVSSGVETDGVKDIEKIRAFIRAAKGAANGA